MPGTDRNILKSLMAYVRGLLKAPPSASGWAPFTVYNEQDLTAFNNGAPGPNWPFIFLLETYMRPKPALLPMIIVEINPVRQMPYELGNRSGRTQTGMIHCFGKTRGQRDDLSSFFLDYLGNTFPVYSYTSTPLGDTSSFVENAEIQPGVLRDLPVKELTPDQRREGTLDLWMIVNFIFRTKT